MTEWCGRMGQLPVSRYIDGILEIPSTDRL
jgi:hypothetical protein